MNDGNVTASQSMWTGIRIAFLTLIISLITALWPSVARADDTALIQRQAGVTERYQKLEELLLRLADMEVAENPERAALLRRAARQSRDKFVLEKLRTATTSLKTEEFQQAVENQESAAKELAGLLTLLMSEDRSNRIRNEKERFQKLIRDLKRNLNNQRSVRARTENQADIKQVEREQKSVTQKSEELKARLAAESNPETDQSKPASADDSQPPKPSNPVSPDDSSKPADESASPQEPSQQSEQQATPSEQQSSPQNQTPGDSPQPSQPNPSDSAPQTPEQQVEQQLQQAIKKMQQAEQELEQAKRSQATEQQRQAEEDLRTAIDQLERILRQLREEEMQRELAKLEARLRKMASMQTKVLDDTVALAAIPAEQRNRQTDLKAGDLAFEEKKITLQADRAMLLLREEGSSVAFPEVVDQIRDDTVRVSDRLSQTKIDAVTQGIQQDILAALEEMIAALAKAQRELEQQRQQQQGQPQQAGQQEQPLVQALAELKLIRTMETRIKSTTQRYSGLLESGESTADDVLPLLQNLSERQNRLYQITRDLVLQRNK